jgi:hypothetical protein
MTDDYTEPEAPNPLSEAQTTRAAALAVARQTLANDGGGPFSHTESLPERFGAADLIEVATWIVTEPVRTVTVVRVPADQVEAVSALNPVDPAEFPNGLLIVPDTAQFIPFHTEEAQP